MMIEAGNIYRIKRIEDMEATRPLLIWSTLKIKDSLWYYGFPISHEVEYAGKGDPFFEGEKEGLSYPFFVELYNPLLISQEYILNKIGKIDKKGINEIKSMLKNRWWIYEECPWVKKFRQKESLIMEKYRKNIKHYLLALILLKILRKRRYYLVNGLVSFPVYRKRSKTKGEEKNRAIRKITVLLENFSKEISISNLLINEALFLLYLLQNRKDRAKKFLKRINLKEKKKEMEHLLKEGTKKVEKKLNMILSEIEKKIENGEVF